MTQITPEPPETPPAHTPAAHTPAAHTPAAHTPASAPGDLKGAPEGVQRPGPAALLSRYGFLVVFSGFFIFFASRSDAFLNSSNLVNILEGNAILLIAALAMTLVVAAGGIDLSVGIAIDFGGWLAIVAMMDYDIAWPLAILVGIIAGAGVGFFNSFLIVWLGVSPFLATLGTFFIGGSIQRIYTSGGGQVPFREMPEGYRSLATGGTLGVPNEIVIGVIVLVVFYVFLERSIHGKRIHAIGLQRTASAVSGINVKLYLWLVFIVAAATASVSGVILTAGLRQFTPLAGFSYLLDSIAAVFIGASMHPQQGPNVPGTLVGVLFLGMVSNGLNLMGLDFNFRDALEGLILVGALALAVSQRRLLNRTGAPT